MSLRSHKLERTMQNKAYKKSVCFFLAIIFTFFATITCASNIIEGWSAYYKGDHHRAHSIWLKEAVEGHAESQFALGALYTEGGVIPQDFSLAAKWFKKAAEQNIPDAQFNLAILHSQGLGVEKNLATAAHWYQEAAKHNMAEAQNKSYTSQAKV